MVPKLTAEQRRAALDKGMQIRLKRAEYKAKLAVPRTQKLMKSLNISTSRRVQGLGYIQREGLIKALGGGSRE